MRIEWAVTWAEFRRLWSVWVLGFIAFAAGAAELVPVIWGELPPEAQAMVPEHWRGWLFGGAAVVGILARAVKQGKP
jgi:hypothetical protein